MMIGISAGFGLDPTGPGSVDLSALLFQAFGAGAPGAFYVLRPAP